MISKNKSNFRLLKKIILLCFSIFLISYIYPDDGEEKIFSLEEDTYHSTELSEYLDKLKKKPLDINKAKEADLSRLPWLSESDVKKISERRKNKGISSLNDLKELGLNEVTIEEIEPFIVFASERSSKFFQMTRLESYEQDKEKESFLKYYQKTLYSIGNFDLGFISQKDSGEKKLLDYYSCFLQYKGKKVLKQMILGKYRAAFGQGILFSPKLGMSKSSEATTIPIKKYNSFKPYTSSYEIWELEGFCSEMNIGNFSFLPFYSNTKLDANLENDEITSFDETGIHLNEDEKDNVKETIFGGVLNYQSANHGAGIMVSHNKFDHNFVDPEIKSQFSMIGLNFLFRRDAHPLFSEIALADNKLAAVLGKKWGENRFRQLMVFRYYEKEFPTWHGHPFSAQSDFDNEIGLYYGMTILPKSRMKVNVYFDVWKFPETRYFEKMPTAGSEEMIQIEQRSRQNVFRITLQHKNKEKYKSLDDVAMIREFQKTTLRFDWWQNSADFRFKTRFEFVGEYLTEERHYEKGILFYEQLRYKTKRLEIIAHIALFHSDVLHYMYENSIDGIMQNSILTGDGIFSYFLLKYQLSSKFEVQFKVSDRWFSDKKMRFYLQVVSEF